MAKFTKVLNPHSREKEIHIIDRYLSNVVMSAKQNTTEEPGFSPERAQREYDEFQHIKAGDFPVVITEKLDGENFRVGYDKEKGGYIGQRNNMWRTDFEDVETKHHPHWNKINIEDKNRYPKTPEHRAKDDRGKQDHGLYQYIRAQQTVCIPDDRNNATEYATCSPIGTQTGNC